MLYYGMSIKKQTHPDAGLFYGMAFALPVSLLFWFALAAVCL